MKNENKKRAIELIKEVIDECCENEATHWIASQCREIRSLIDCEEESEYDTLSKKVAELRDVFYTDDDLPSEAIASPEDCIDSIIYRLENREKEGWISVNRMQKDTACPYGVTYKHSDIPLLVGQKNCMKCRAYCGQNDRGFVFCNPYELQKQQTKDSEL